MGLLHPIVVTPDNRLIAGKRRIEACKMLGWAEVPVRVVDIEAIVYGEREENTARKDFVPSEAVAVRNACIELEHTAARERQARAGGAAPGKLPEAVTTGRARDKSSRGTAGQLPGAARARLLSCGYSSSPGAEIATRPRSARVAA